jgi:hypothetical protein
MYKNRVLRERFGSMREEVKGDWRKLHNEKLISLPNIHVIKSRRGWVGHVVRMGERTGAYMGLVGKPEGKNHVEDLGVDGRIILQCMLKKSFGKVWTGVIWLKIGASGGLS